MTMAFTKNILQPLDYFTTERRILMISVIIALAQGLNNVSDLSISYLYKDDYKLSPTQVAGIASFMTLPWLLKPCWGMISDNIPLFGYKRKSYICLLGLCGFMCYWLLANWSTSMYSGMFLIFSISIVFAFNNVIGEALLVETAQKFGTSPGRTEAEKQQQASQNVSTFFAVKHTGIVISSYAGGLLLEYLPKTEIFKIASVPPLCVALIALTLPEVKPFIKRFQRPIRLTREEEETSNLIEEITYSPESHMLSTGDSAMDKIKNFLKKPEIYKPLIFLFFFMITPSAGSAMFFFYTNELKFAPEFMGKLKLASSCAVIMGIIIYNKFLRNTPFQKILYWSTIICFFLGLSQILLLKRINVQLGIPDKLFCIGDSIIIQVFGELNFLPILILACRLCPKDVEGTMYALFLAIFNLGGIISVQMGALFTWLLGITEKDFSNMWIMVLISAFFIILPLPWIKKIEFDAAVKTTEEERSLAVGPGSGTADNDFDESSLKSF